MTQDRSARTNRNSSATQGHLMSRPLSPAPAAIGQAPPTGLLPLKLGSERDGFLYTPANYQPEHPMPLVMMLHGAGGTANSIIAPFTTEAEREGMILLAPDSRQQSWDIIMSRYGADVAFVDQALEQTFRSYTVDTTHVAISGFSDGASYALSLGLANGYLFTHILAFSPGFMAPSRLQGHPLIFISHGTHDQVLSVANSRRMAEELRDTGYDVSYHEFNGPHTVPPSIAREAFAWFIAGSR